MCFDSLQRVLERELSSASAQRAFEHARACHPELQRYGTVTSMLALLTCRGAACHLEKERLLRAVLRAARGGPRAALWKAVLIYTFLPSLRVMRQWYRTLSPSAEEREDLLWSSFFEVVERYPLDRGSMAAGLVMDTRKLFRARLQALEEKHRAFEEMLRAFEQLPPEVRAMGSVAETGPLLQLDDIDRQEMRDVLHQCPSLTDEDVDLLWETGVCGMRLIEYLHARGFSSEDPEQLERAHERLRRRRTRAKKRLYEFLKKS